MVVLDADGTLNVSDLRVPLSGYASAALNEAFVARAKMALGTSRPQMPLMTAPREEWQAFFALLDRATANLLEWTRGEYPVEVEYAKVAGVPAAIINPRRADRPAGPDRVLIHLRGGVYRGTNQGEIESIPVASLGNFKVVTLDYRQEPFHRYPAPSEDVEAVYREPLREYAPDSIGIFGNSFGGIVTAQATAWIQAAGLPRPGAIGVLLAGLPASPFPFGHWGDSRMWGTDGVPPGDHASQDLLMANVSWYLEGVASDDPRAYPAASDDVLAKFPPTLFLTGTRSHDLSPSCASHARLARLGVDAALYVIEGGWHGASLLSNVPESRDASRFIANWFDAKLKPSGPESR